MSPSPSTNSPATLQQNPPERTRRNRSFLDAWPEILFAAFILLFVTIRLLEQHALFQSAPGSDWNSSEWMIDYAAGFVRRGLGGELLKRLMHLTGLGFFPLWATITTSVYLAACWHLMRISRRLGGSKLWRFCLLFNSALLVFPLECRLLGSFMRKELLFVLGTALLVSLCERTLRGNSTPSLFSALPVLSVACVVSIVLALMHEGMFLFEWFPLNMSLLLAMLLRFQRGKMLAALIALLTLMPALAVTAASFHWHGDVRTGQITCESWHADSIPTVCAVNESNPSQFDAIGWTASRVARDTLNHAWRFPIFLLIFALMSAFELAAIRRLIPAANLSQLVAILVLPLLISIPIFLSNDWGRYLFTLMAQQVFVMLSNVMRPAFFQALPAAFAATLKWCDGPRQQRRLETFARIVESHPLVFCLALFLFPVPGTMPERTLYKQSPPVILFDFWKQMRSGELP